VSRAPDVRGPRSTVTPHVPRHHLWCPRTFAADARPCGLRSRSSVSTGCGRLDGCSMISPPMATAALVKPSFVRLAAAVLAIAVIAPVGAAGPAYVDMTWLSISNMHYEVGPLRILMDGYITRLPQSAFFGGGGG